jgi:uncharacterized protein (UPF0332 family)
MSVVFNDFLQSAENLLNNPDSKEIDFRNLMSRSYYALFHLSREIAETLSLPNSENNKYGSHEKVIAQFDQNPRTKKLAYFINQRKLARCKADYDIQEHIVRLEAAQHFHAVKDLIKKLEQLKENP